MTDPGIERLICAGFEPDMWPFIRGSNHRVQAVEWGVAIADLGNAFLREAVLVSGDSRNVLFMSAPTMSLAAPFCALGVVTSGVVMTTRHRSTSFDRMMKMYPVGSLVKYNSNVNRFLCEVDSYDVDGERIRLRHKGSLYVWASPEAIEPYHGSRSTKDVGCSLGRLHRLPDLYEPGQAMHGYWTTLSTTGRPRTVVVGSCDAMRNEWQLPALIVDGASACFQQTVPFQTGEKVSAIAACEFASLACDDYRNDDPPVVVIYRGLGSWIAARRRYRERISIVLIDNAADRSWADAIQAEIFQRGKQPDWSERLLKSSCNDGMGSINAHAVMGWV